MFAAIASGNPLQPSTEVPNTNGLQHTILLSETKAKSYSHISLFILPGVTFPPEYLATVYFKLSPDEEFKLFGQLGAEKPSAIFKVKLPNPSLNNRSTTSEGLGEIDMDNEEGVAASPHNISELIIGISIEPREMALAKLAQWKAEQSQTVNNNALVVRKSATGSISTPGELARAYPSLTQQLASKIVQHAYNYLTGFVDSSNSVPIKKFENWWDKFNKRLENDATFLDEISSE
ncbi:HBL069Wp [Eremothecium sinecaudum]|uniref:HBL069Wp n=1 Tax=Eremothecium sinecaudum TaxID=45286 RepID=A0A109UWL7_9SACH|nr:HBL069Wp [Eremothecium sinecaudum]AMD18833.1 HBL069Wp [Eremothecium sinecaudum]